MTSVCMGGEGLSGFEGHCVTMDMLLSSLGLSFLIWKQETQSPSGPSILDKELVKIRDTDVQC